MSGRVQGVWFRQSCAEEARSAAVRGWVRNASDGRVEAVFEGDEAGVARMVDWCRRGPIRADVVEVEVRTEEPEGYTGFSIKGWD